MLSIWPQSCVKSVVIVTKTNLGYVQRTLCAPFANVHPHVDCSHDSFDSAGRLPVQTVFQSCKHIATGVFQI